MTRREFAVSTATFAMSGGFARAAMTGARPSKRQLRWQSLELTAFLHFNMNTFTDREWGLGDEDPNLFRPAALDANGIAADLAGSGFRGMILTCKHHDGFCLWPTKTTEHSVSHSAWRGGKSDVVREFSEAAKKNGLLFGVYLSPWDRNNAVYGKPEYIPLYRRQLTELLTNYGPIFEVWFDGANGGDGYYGGAKEKRVIDKRTYYDWPGTWDLVRKLQPEAAIFSDVGPDIRWVGNEKGIAGDPCWATYDPVGENGGPAAPGDVRASDSATGTENGSHWMPAECDVSIRPGWFWHASENAKVKTPSKLMDLYFHSVGRGAGLLLNVPPNREGRLSKEDVEALRGFQRLRSAMFRQNLLQRTQGVTAVQEACCPMIGFNLNNPTTFRVIRLREDLTDGQQIRSVKILAPEEIATATSVGNCRLIRLEKPVTTSRLGLEIRGVGEPKLKSVELFG